MKLAAGAAFAVLLSCGPIQAQQADHGSQPLSGDDRHFLRYAAEDNQAEIRLCLVAEKRAMDPALKAFARLMVDDHVEVESRLAALANELHADLPDDVGKEGRETGSKLEPLSGEEFERAFIKAQIKDHSDDVEKFSRESGSTQNARIRQFATETIALLQQHLALARAVDAQLEQQTVGKGSRPRAPTP